MDLMDIAIAKGLQTNGSGGSNSSGSSSNSTETVFIPFTMRIGTGYTNIMGTTQKSAKEIFSALIEGKRVIFVGNAPYPMSGIHRIEVLHWQTNGSSYVPNDYWAITCLAPIISGTSSFKTLTWTGGQTEDDPLEFNYTTS